uniref:Nuclear receptor domain-containing protein n=1 Tax=Meloidogyne enterolobii TaxID=390850 RepID=A0A6V7U2X3_MELEN|nr:unnamed protein product [Meloidogyne enterolobii]
MDPLSKYSKKICGNKRLIENLKYEIKCHENEGKLVWTKKLLTPPFNCSICSQVCSYHYYGVLCCEGCKQFFRRIIIKQKIPTCIMNYRCDITQGDRCQGCRFNKCLLMGMDASLICVQNTEDLDKFIENLKEYQLEVIAQYYEQIAPNNDNQLDYDCNKLC